MSELEPGPEPESNQPWWNDGDKVGGLIATILLILFVILIAAGVVKFLFWLF